MGPWLSLRYRFKVPRFNSSELASLCAVQWGILPSPIGTVYNPQLIPTIALVCVPPEFPDDLVDLVHLQLVVAHDAPAE